MLAAQRRRTRWLSLLQRPAGRLWWQKPSLRCLISRPAKAAAAYGHVHVGMPRLRRSGRWRRRFVARLRRRLGD